MKSLNWANAKISDKFLIGNDISEIEAKYNRNND